MKQITLSDALSRNKSIYGKASKRVITRMGRATSNYDSDLAKYQKLTNEDFENLSREFGFDKVGTYIRHMEHRLMKEKK
jgi:cephalosporin hydroxylase